MADEHHGAVVRADDSVVPRHRHDDYQIEDDCDRGSCLRGPFRSVEERPVVRDPLVPRAPVFVRITP